MLKLSVCLSLVVLLGCGDDGVEADVLGVAAECTVPEDCDQDTNQTCLLDFKGGYCGIEDCTEDADCPEASACVAHDNGTSYCFRICVDKAECNQNRSVDNEANCSSNITFVEQQRESIKACVPPSA